MIAHDQPLRSQMIKRMIETIKKSPDVFTDWEVNFIESISNQFETKGDLSNKQCEILERIYDK